MLLIIGFYSTINLFSIKGIRSLSLHGILWGLIGICVVGYLNTLNDPEYLVKIGLIAQLTAFLFCVISGGDELKSGARKGQGMAIFISILVILGLLVVSYLCLGKIPVNQALNIIGLSVYGYLICLIGIATFGYATAINGISLGSKSISVLGIIIYVVMCLIAYLLINGYTVYSMQENILSFVHSKEAYPFFGLLFTSIIIFFLISYKWLTNGKKNIIYPLLASIVPSLLFGLFAFLNSNFLSMSFGTTSPINFSIKLLLQTKPFWFPLLLQT